MTTEDGLYCSFRDFALMGLRSARITIDTIDGFVGFFVIEQWIYIRSIDEGNILVTIDPLISHSYFIPGDTQVRVWFGKLPGEKNYDPSLQHSGAVR